MGFLRVAARRARGQRSTAQRGEPSGRGLRRGPPGLLEEIARRTAAEELRLRTSALRGRSGNAVLDDSALLIQSGVFAKSCAESCR